MYILLTVTRSNCLWANDGRYAKLYNCVINKFASFYGKQVRTYNQF